MTLKNEILRLLDRNDRLRFKNIRDQTQPRNKDEKGWSVQVANCLNDLRQEKLVTREYVDRESWYAITDTGRSTLLKTRATDEIAKSPFWAYDCQLVESHDGRTNASVYWSGPVDLFARRQISDVLKKYPGIKILGHEKTDEGKKKS